MTHDMWQMATEHVSFHYNFTDSRQRLETVKEKHDGRKVDAKVIRSIALDPYLSRENLSKVITFGHMEMEHVLKKFYEEEMHLGNLQKETEKRVQAPMNDEDYKSGDVKNARA